jgi:dGTPase
VARTVAQILDLDVDLTEALALGHDIGHPPFAHAGEFELDRLMRRFGESFDHNRHALRVVESFEHRYARFPGLNLTFEVREGLVKHSRDLVPGEDPSLEEYLPDLRPPLEAQLIDLADEIAYNTADLDDALSAGIITIPEIREGVPPVAALLDQAAKRYPGASERVLFHESLRLLFDGLVSGLIAGTLAAAEVAGVASPAAVREHPTRLACLDADSAALNGALKRFLLGHAYRTPVLLAARERAAGMIASLFDHYLDDPARMGQPYADLAREGAPHCVVCDYIAGMTDSFLERAYAEAVSDT